MALHLLGLERRAGLVGVDRLVLGGVVLEDAPQLAEEADQRRGRRPAARCGSPPSISRKTQVEPGLIQFVSSAGETLKSSSEKPIANTKAPISAKRLSSSDASSSPSSVTEKRAETGERAHADRERLAQRDHAADDRQAQPAAAQRDAVDVVRDLGDAPVGTAHRHGPARRTAHHHALEHRLTTDRRHQAAIN